MTRIWICSNAIEDTLHEAFSQADVEFSTYLEQEIMSHEERLTGSFVTTLCKKVGEVRELIKEWGNKLKVGPWYISMRYRDVTPKRGEKTLGADMAFLLSVYIRNRMRRRKAILVQSKKIRAQMNNSGIRFLPSWPIKYAQAKDLSGKTPFGYYFLYGPNFDNTRTRVISCKSVLGLLSACNRAASIPLGQTISTSRSLADFLLYDFIGCWVGDETKEIIKIAEGEHPEIGVRYIINISISHG